MAAQKVVKIMTSSGNVHTVNYDAMMLSETVKNLVSDINDQETPVPLPNIDDETFQKIVEFCEYHMNNEIEYDEKKKLEFKLSDWDVNFMNVSDKLKFKLLSASSYLAIFQLTKVVAKSIAMDIEKYNTVDEIRDRYHIVNDFTDEEEETVQKEIAWIDSNYMTKKQKLVKQTTEQSPKKKHADN